MKPQAFKGILANLTLVLLGLLPFSFALSRRWAVVFLGLVILCRFLSGNLSSFREVFKFRAIIWMFILFFSYLIGFFYSDGFHVSSIEKKLSLIVLPLLLFSIKPNDNLLHLSLISFVLGCIVLSIYSLIYVILNDLPFDTEMTFHVFDISHVYASLYIVFSIIILIHYFLLKRNSFIRLSLVLVVTVMLVFLYFLGGKMAIISFLLLCFTGAVIIIVGSKRNRTLKLILFLFPVATFVFALFSIEKIQSRFSYLINKEHYFVGDNAWSSIGVRFTILSCSYETIKENLFWGSGSGDVQDDLDNCFSRNNFSTVIGMNAHNQFIQTLLDVGLFGLSLLLMMFFFIFKEAYIHRNYLLGSFLFIFFLCCLSESLLERQQGVLLFSYFVSIFLIFGRSKLSNQVKPN